MFSVKTLVKYNKHKTFNTNLLDKYYNVINKIKYITM